MPARRTLRVKGLPDAGVLRDAASCVAGGGMLIFPTDTVYGIGCDPDDVQAVAAIFSAKRRAAHKPLAVHVAEPDDARPFARVLTVAAERLMHTLWPGPLAIVVERAPGRAAAAACEGATLSLRCPDDAACASILRATGPLAATSANFSGKAAFTGKSEDESMLPDADLAIITGPTRGGRESTVLDCTSNAVRVLRHGALDEAQISRALAGCEGVSLVT
jgi:tRNA threonylcarbamoyl adenosine modification protein (Sua5/YciO/YrdC/YwlC family)